MNLNIRKSSRKQAKIKAALTGPSGSGKTYSSLLLARGLTSAWDKIAVIDTENGSADLYAHLGDYQVITLSHPFSPEHYIKAIELAERANVEVIIIDSLSHCWEYLLDVHGNMVGNSFTNWSKITPRHNALVQKILRSPAHIVATLRTKQDYVLNQKNGKYVPEKVGLKAIQRDGVDYEFTLVFDIDVKHHAIAAKDRTGLFMDLPQFTITSATGETIKAWCEEGDAEAYGDIRERILETRSLSQLIDLYNSHPEAQAVLKDDFTAQKQALTSTKVSMEAISEASVSLNHTERRGNNG